LYSNKNIPRSGIIHRLDKETSGVMILAKTIVAYIKLLSHQQAGLITKIYFALVTGTMDDSGTINMPIGKKKGNNFKMIIDKDGKTSTTHYKIIKQYYDYNYIKILLDTGRTHQIRVHMEHIHNPVFQDKVYNIYSKKINHKTQLQRHALHASQISFYHPVYKIPMHFISMLPGDLKNLLFISK